METKTTNQYFVILWQKELEMEATPAEKLVYAAVKSFTANGTIPCKESYLSISKRAGVDSKWTKVCVEKLLKKGYLIRRGEGTKRGGRYPIIEVWTHTKLKSESLDSHPLSLESLASKCKQSNKVNILTSRDKPRDRGKDLNFQVKFKSLLSYMFSKTGTKTVLPGKQARAVKQIFRAGYTEQDIRWAIDKLWSDSYWQERGFDFMTIADQLPKLKMSQKKGGSRDWRDEIPKG